MRLTEAVMIDAELRVHTGKQGYRLRPSDGLLGVST